jgi:ubiquinone/menaquinone biosynthesis C-methylase UbiE
MPELESMEHFFSVSEKRRLEAVSSMMSLKKGMRILDAGCGTGHLLEILASSGNDTFGADLGFESIRKASVRLKNKGLKVRFTRGDIYRLPFGNASFDAVFASEIIEHLENPSDAVREVARVLKPGGFLVISTPYRENLRYTLCIHCNKKTPVNAHLHSFDEKSLGIMLESAGLKVEKELKFASRILEQLRIPGMTYFLPGGLWRLIDSFFCGLSGKQSFISIRAKRIG